MNDEQSRRKAWECALTNTKIEFPDWQPEEEYLQLVEKYIKGEMVIDEIIRLLIEKWEVD